MNLNKTQPSKLNTEILAKQIENPVDNPNDRLAFNRMKFIVDLLRVSPICIGEKKSTESVVLAVECEGSFDRHC